MFMQVQLSRRQERNPRFSLRAFAKLLKTDPSSLSKILNGTRIPSLETAEKWIPIMQLSEEEAQQFLDLVASGDQFKQLPESFPKHLINSNVPIILEALALENFQDRKPELLQFLKLTEVEFEQQIAELHRLGLLAIDKKGNGYRPVKVITGTSPLTAEERRQMLIQYAEWALESVKNHEPVKRGQSNLTISLNAEDIPKIHEIMREALFKITNIVAKSKPANSLYNITYAYYPILKDPEDGNPIGHGSTI